MNPRDDARMAATPALRPAMTAPDVAGFKEPIGRAVDEIDILRAVLKPCLDNSDDLPVRLAFGVDSILVAMRERLEAVWEQTTPATTPRSGSKKSTR